MGTTHIAPGPPVRSRFRGGDLTRPSPQPETTIAITGGIFSKEVVMALVDDCIVPALVDEFLRTRINLPDPTPSAHNETRLRGYQNPPQAQQVEISLGTPFSTDSRVRMPHLDIGAISPVEITNGNDSQRAGTSCSRQTARRGFYQTESAAGFHPGNHRRSILPRGCHGACG